MKYLILFALLISGAAYGQSTYYIRADSTRLQKVGGNNTLIIENATRTLTGAYLKNNLNGRTIFSYAGDSISVSGSNLSLWRGNGTQNVTVAIPGAGGITALTGDGTATGPGSVPFTLATVNANVGSFTYGSFTVNGKGLITAASSGAAPVTGSGVANQVTYWSSSTDITGHVNYTFTPGNNPALLIKGNNGGGLYLGSHTTLATYGAIYNTGVTPGATNFALSTNGADTYLNGTTSSVLSANGNSKVVVGLTDVWLLDDLLFTDNTNDIGEIANRRPRTVYIGTSGVAPLFNATTGFQVAGAAGSRKILVGNGTNFIPSTETYAVPGTTGNVLTSDGTDWISAAPATSGTVTGSGTLNYIPKWTPNGTTLGNSQIFDDGSFVGIGTAGPSGKLEVNTATSVYNNATLGALNLSYDATKRIYAGYDGGIDAGFIQATDFGTSYKNLVLNAAGGNVGIGGTTAGVKFVNQGGINASAPTLGSGTIGSNAILSASGLFGLYTGISNSGDVWQQVQRNDGGATVYNLLLQPSGGNVILGGGATAANLRFMEPSGSGTNYIEDIAPAMAANQTYTRTNAYPAGNGYLLGSTTAGVQSWVDPASLVTATPTWQQTLTAGSTLTGNNFINVGGNALQFQTASTFTADATGGASISNNGVSGFTTSLDASNLAAALSATNGSVGRSDIEVQPDTIKLKPSLGHLYIDTLTNLSTQNTLLGWRQGASQGDVGYVTMGSGVSLAAGVLSATGTGVLSLSAIGATPNANAATITGTVLNLQPASASFGGVVTTGTQTFTGIKTFTGGYTGVDSLRISNAVAAEEYQIGHRMNLGLIFPVVTVKPATATKNMAFNIGPTGAPGNYSDNGIAWLHVTDTDVSHGAGNVTVAHVGISTTAVQFGSRTFGGTSKPLQLVVDAATKVNIASATNTADFNIGKITQSQALSGDYVGYSLLNTNNTVAESNPILFIGQSLTNTHGYLRWNNNATDVGWRDPNQFEIISNLGGTNGMAIGTLDGPIKFIADNSGTGIEIARFTETGQLGIGTTPVASAKLEVSSTTTGFLPPRMTATQASAISSPAEGLLVYVTDTNGTFTAKGWWGYDGAAWQKLNN